MREPTLKALPPRALRRNRMLLTLGLGVFVPMLGVWCGAMLTDLRPAPLLVMVDDVAISNRMTPAISTASRVQTSVAYLPSSLLATAGITSSSSNSADDAVEHSLAEASGQRCDDRPESDADVRWFNGRPIRSAGTMTMVVTAYSPDERSCGESADGITASGYSVWTNGMKMVAADTDVLPFGTLVSVPGYDGENVVPVLDRGGAIKGKRLDVLYPTHDQACTWGVQRLTVTIWEYADGLPSDFRTQHHVASR